MAEEVKKPVVAETSKKIKISDEDSGFVVLEFVKEHGTKKEGDKETYHHSTANALVGKLGVAKVVSHVKKYVPKKAKE